MLDNNGRCGCTFTAETKKKRYIYYHCTFAKGKCKSAYLREESVDDILGEMTKAVQIEQEFLDHLIRGMVPCTRTLI